MATPGRFPCLAVFPLRCSFQRLRPIPTARVPVKPWFCQSYSDQLRQRDSLIQLPRLSKFLKLRHINFVSISTSPKTKSFRSYALQIVGNADLRSSSELEMVPTGVTRPLPDCIGLLVEIHFCGEHRRTVRDLRFNCGHS